MLSWGLGMRNHSGFSEGLKKIAALLYGTTRHGTHKKILCRKITIM